MKLSSYLLVLALAQVPGSAVAQVIDTRHYIYAEGSGHVQAAADLTHIAISISEKNATPEQATADVTKAVAGLRQALAKLGIADEQIATDSFRFEKVYVIATDKSGKPVSLTPDPDRDKLAGYRASYAATVTLMSTDKIGDVLSRASALGVEVLSVSFASSHEFDFEQQARKIATDNARKKAERMAKSLDSTLGDVLSVREGTGYDPDTMDYQSNEGGEADLMAPQGGDSLSIAPGMLTFSASVSVKWEIRGTEGQP